MTAAGRWRFEPNDFAQHLRQASAEVDAILVARGLSERARLAAKLVAEEIVVNAFEHGGARFVSMEIGGAQHQHDLNFEDDGVSFDPSRFTPTSTSGDLESTPLRGRGLMLVQRFTRMIDHGRADGRNRLRVQLVE